MTARPTFLLNLISTRFQLSDKNPKPTPEVLFNLFGKLQITGFSHQNWRYHMFFLLCNFTHFFHQVFIDTINLIHVITMKKRFFFVNSRISVRAIHHKTYTLSGSFLEYLKYDMHSYTITIAFKHSWEKRYFFRKERIKLIVSPKKTPKINATLLKCTQRNKGSKGVILQR